MRKVEIKSRDAAKIWIIENQFSRRNITPYTRAALALILAPLYTAQAKKRQATSTGGSAPQLVPTLAQAKGKTRDKVAKAAKLSHGTLDSPCSSRGIVLAGLASAVLLQAGIVSAGAAGLAPCRSEMGRLRRIVP